MGRSVLIVGGGISGLVLAEACIRRGFDVTLVERNDHVGGRIHSMKHYECGAFRVHRSHTRVFALAKRLGVRLTPWRLRYVHVGMVGMAAVSAASLHTGKSAGGQGVGDSPVPDNVTWWDIEADARGFLAAEGRDVETGYRGSTDVSAQAYPMDMEHEDGWYFAPGGLSSFVRRLERRVAPHIRMLLSTRVTECELEGASPDHRFRVTWLARASGGESTLVFDRVLFAAPPQQVAQLSIVRQFGPPLVHAVQSRPLHRIYARVGGLTPSQLKALEGTKILSPSLLGQTLGVPHMHNRSQLPWIQVAYCEGQLARFWQDLLLSKGRDAFVRRLTKEVRAVLGVFFRSRAAASRVTLSDVDSHFWSEAVHAWWASFGKARDESMAVLHATRCPGAGFANEALSFRQGWIEGSLESVARLLASGCVDGSGRGRSVHARRLSARRALPRYRGLSEVAEAMAGVGEWVVLDGRVLDVGAWKAVHPGSTKAVENHLFEDISVLWRVIHAHFPDAWRQVLALQIGWVE